MNPRVAIVIVNWNKKDYILNLLRSLSSLHYDNYEIIVVDNASTDSSVEAIRQQHSSVHLIINPENLGGTGGFNTGMRYALVKGDYKYIWLLDNDAEVEKETLRELVNAIETDNTIGIAGSRIMSPENRELIVELGGFVDWDSVTWRPHLRYLNEKDYSGYNVIETDYVATCSALVRKEVIKSLGLMDEKFFLHCDDIDFCLRLKKNGFKVVAVFSSKVFHSVEKGFIPQVLYYDYRNFLLLISKHLGGLRRFLSVIKLLKTSSESLLYFFFDKKIFESKLIFFALYDFCINNFHKMTRNIKETSHPQKKDYINDREIQSAKNILILQNGAYEEVRKAILAVRKIAPNAHVHLLVHRDKKNLYGDTDVNQYITFDLFKDSTVQKAMLFLKLLLSNFRLGVSTDNPFLLPFVYCTRKNIVYDQKIDSFYIIENNSYNLWKIVLSVFLGDFFAILFLSPFFYLLSFKYAESQHQYYKKQV